MKRTQMARCGLLFLFFMMAGVMVSSVFAAPAESKYVYRAGDYDGNGYDDLCVYYAASGTWTIWYNNNGTLTGQATTSFGWSGARAVPADYDGDGKTDLAVYAPSSGTWTINSSKTKKTYSVNWGWSEAMPVPADYDGDGRDDIAVFYPGDGSWSIRFASGKTRTVNFGYSAVIPVPADYNGDGRDDIAVYIPDSGAWMAVDVQTGKTVLNQNWGWPAARPAPADYSGDGKADPCVYAGGTWYISFRSGVTMTAQWGGGPVKLVPGFYRSYYGTAYPHAQVGVYIASSGTWARKEVVIDLLDPWFKQVNFGWSQSLPPPYRP
ncbi:MAG: VCBS repeat-containing protein [Kiritimatiellae bacterium]|nr:VCBS repeat-containing protein [Kiritimatiellia bacterium]